MKWESIVATQFCDSVRDGTHDTPKQTSEGKRLITSKHIKYGQILSEEGYFISEKDYESINRRSEVDQWDVLMSMIGTVGEAAIVKEKPSFAIKNVALFKCGDAVKANWLYYYLCSDEGKGQLFGKQKGASQQFISLTQLRDLQIPNPCSDTQRRITNILSTYDNLIENNQKQIKLLEEAAMRLYKEWFVQLRFPGHETTPIVDGVPEGWAQTKLRQHISVNPNSITQSYKHEHIKYIDISSVSMGRVENKVEYLRKEAPGRAKRLAADGDTIWGMVRPNLKSYALILEPDDNDVFSTGFAILSPRSIPSTFLHCLVIQDEFVGYLINCTNGAAYPAVKPNHFEEYVALIPIAEILSQFHEIVEPLFRKCKKLDAQIVLLRQARDKLLPKLMSGEIEV